MSKFSEEIAFYKKFAPKYDERNYSVVSRMYYGYWDKLLMGKLGKKSDLKVLDLGCGTGDFLDKLNKRFKKSVGVDISPEMLKIAKEKYPHLIKKLIISKAESIPFKDGYFDAVFIRGALHHFQNPEKSLKEINRILKKNGQLVFLEPCSDFLLMRFLRKVFFKFKPKKFLSQHRSFTIDELKKMLEKTNFKIRSWTRLGFIAYPLCARPDIFPFLKYFSAKKKLVNFLIKLDEFIIKYIFWDKLSLLVIFDAEKK